MILDSTTNIFGSFNSHRAALSLLTSKNLAGDIQLKRFMKGVFRLRPPKPRYECTWNPEKVLLFFQISDNTSLKILSYKTITLLALATAQRIQTLSLIKLRHIHISSMEIKIYIPDLIKTSRPNFPQPCINLPFLLENPPLCVASTLKKYLDSTKLLRNPNSEKLFLTYVKPHHPASKQTLSRWIKESLGLAGVDSTVFKAHSTRHASTSAALRQGVSIDLIQKSAGWSATNTFARFYNRPLADENTMFKTIFNIKK